jgi:hypothetical protein
MERNQTKLINKLIKKLCKKEAGKKQINAGQAREVIKITAFLLVNDDEFHADFIAYLQTMNYQLN